jgi:SNF2 family DNA or RNA helicase
VILATATPTGQGNPTDAWALAKIVDPTRVPRYFGAFRRLTMQQITQFKWIPLQNSSQTVFEALQPAFRVKKRDVLKDLPPVTTQRLQCELTEEQTRMYKEMKRDMQMEYKNGTVQAVNGADKIGKCLQVLLGVYKIGEDEYQTIDCQPRIDLILDCIKKASKKTIIFMGYKGSLKHYCREIKKHYTADFVDGDVDKNARDKIFYEFQHSAHPQVLLAHPKTCAHGLEFSCADTIIWPGPIHSGRQFTQACERNASIAQDSDMTIYYIGASPLEWKIFDGLENKKDINNNVLELYRQVVEE